MADATARLLLVRHAESEGNRDRCFTPTPDVPITEAGRAQAHATAELLASRYRPIRLVTSPYRRARQTAGRLAARRGLGVEVEEALRERSYGTLAGQPYAAVRAYPDWDPLEYWRWCPPEGETFDAVVVRAGAVLDRIARA